MDKIPKPGTKEAVALGCLCPVIDNHYGRGIPRDDGSGKVDYWYNESCEVHKS